MKVRYDPGNPFHGHVVDLRVIFKTDKIPSCAKSGNSGRAAPGANIRYQFSRLGVGSNQLFTQRNRFLCGMDGMGFTGEVQYINRKPPPVGRYTALTLELAIVGA